MRQIMINSISLINIPFLELKSQLDAAVRGGAKWFHIDLMDGHYVPNLCFPIEIISQLKKAYPEIVMDIHVMVTDPVAYIERLKEAGADYVSFHVDATNFVRRTIAKIHQADMKAGIILNPSQRVDVIEPYVGDADLVMLMAVEPGFSGQAFLPGSMERLAQLAEIRRKTGSKFLLSVDGGVDLEKEKSCCETGVNVIVGTKHNIFHQPEGLEAACRRFETQYGCANII